MYTSYGVLRLSAPVTMCSEGAYANGEFQSVPQVDARCMHVRTRFIAICVKPYTLWAAGRSLRGVS